MKEIPKSLFIRDNQTINEALLAINSYPKLRIAIVLDANKNLVGTVTDGDVRRGLLANKNLTDSVTKIMNHNPKTATVETTQESLAEIVRQNEIEVILITNKGKVAGIESAKKILKIKPKLYDNPIFIMAGGFGSRLKPLTDNCPKPMLKVGNKPILETQIDQFIALGFNNFYISTHYLSEQITKYFGDGAKKGIKITYVHEENPLGTGGALGLLPKNIPRCPIIMINGDLLTKIDYRKLLEFHIDQKAEATMCVREYEYQVPFGVVNGKDSKITSISEKPIQRFFINTGIYVINNSIIDNLENNNYLDMPTLLEKQIANGKKIIKFPVYEYWLDIGRKADFERAQIDYRNLGF